MGCDIDMNKPIQELVEYLNELGYSLVDSENHIGESSVMNLTCKNNHSTNISLYDLNRRKHKTCKICRSNLKWNSRIGEVYHELTFLKYEGNGLAEFQCSCGELALKNYQDVAKGKVKSCGHILESRKLPNMVGMKFNKLTAIEELEIVDGQREYKFKCDCGKEIIRKMKEVKREKLMSCGCGILEGVKLSNTTHGMTKTRLYSTWRNMLGRCFNEKEKAYKYYGARGVEVCDEWREDFMSFYDWAMSNGYDETLTIDRIAVNGNYEPSNCRWTTLDVQANNKTNTIYYTHEGETLPLSEWAKRYNIPYSTLHKRLYTYNYSFEKAIIYKRNT